MSDLSGDLRERIAQAIFAADDNGDEWGYFHATVHHHYRGLADAVLAVLADTESDVIGSLGSAATRRAHTEAEYEPDDGKAESIRPTCPTWRDEVHTEEAPEWGMYLEGCHRSDCDLQVVRPGKEQCCGDYDGFGCWWTKADALVGLERDENPA